MTQQEQAEYWINGDPDGPLGQLTGEVFRALERSRKANDQQAVEVLRWVHERICQARYEIRGDEWPEDRPVPAAPHVDGELTSAKEP